MERTLGSAHLQTPQTFFTLHNVGCCRLSCEITTQKSHVMASKFEMPRADDREIKETAE
jgi:hypothetical protein